MLVLGTREGQLQVAAVFDLAAEFAELIGDGMNDLAAPIRHHHRDVASNDIRTAQVEQLPGHDQAVRARRGLDFQIQLIRISAIEHLSSTHVGRAEACKSRLEKAIEEQPDSAANFLSFRYQSGRYKTGLDDAERVGRRLVTGFPS